jgi:hypothetical protein
MRTRGFVGTPLAAALALLAGPALPVPTAAQSPVRIVITFTEVRVGAAGEDPREVTIEATLLGGNRITEVDRRARPGDGGGGGGRSRQNESTFGSGVRPFEGRGSTATWRVGDGNTLVRTLVRRNDIETTTVALTDRNACQATVTFRLRPHHPCSPRRKGYLQGRPRRECFMQHFRVRPASIARLRERQCGAWLWPSREAA